MDPVAGLEIERYRLVKPLGQGGLGQVWLARDVKLGRKVALKLLRTDRAANPGLAHALLAEAQAMAKLSHPHIATVYASGEWEGQTFIALEYLEGTSLRERLAPGLGRKEAIRIAASVASALDAAHQRQLVHGDVKPENVLVPEDGRVRLVDFGLARTSGEWVAAREGTSAYLPPERAESSVATPATDVWGLGVTLHELLTGQRPNGAPVATLEAPLKQLVSDCLASDPRARPSAEQVATSLMQLLDERVERERLPFRSLSSFGEADHGLFFGREAEALALVEKLRRAPLVTLIGHSGVGKSSLIQAGLVPRLREAGRWRVVTVRPGVRPLRALADALCEGRAQWQAQPTLAPGQSVPRATGESLESALRSGKGRLARELAALAEESNANVLLVIDQGEEALTHSPEDAAALFSGLAETLEEPNVKVRIVLCLREEFLGPAVRAAGSSLGDIVVLHPIDPARLVQTLTGPLALVGHRFEDDRLAQDMVEGVRGSPSALPLLQFCAAKLWETRDVERRCVLRASFVALGGVVGALVHHADSVLEGLTAEELSWARTLFMRAVTEYGTRRVNSERLLLEGLPPGAARVLARLVEGRLLVSRRRSESDEPQLELAHEALLSEWTRLKRWREEGGERAARVAELRERATRWDQRQREPSALLIAEEAEEASRLASQEPVDAVSRAFVEASLEAHRRGVRLRRAALTLAALVVTAFVVVLLGLWRRSSENEAAARRAEARALLETAEAALARLDPFEARARATRAIELSDDVSGHQTWFRLERSSLRDAVRTDGPVWEVSFSPDGKHLAMAREANDVLVVELETHAQRKLEGHQAEVVAVAFGPLGKRLLSADHLGVVRLWSWPEGASEVIGQHEAEVYSLAFSSDGRLAASGALDRLVIAYDLQAKKELHRWELDTVALSVAFAPDGTLLATSTSERLWRFDPRDGRSLEPLTVQRLATSAVPSSDGKLVVASGNDTTARVFELRSGEERAITRVHLGPLYEVAAHPSQPLFATAGRDGTARVFDFATAQEQRAFGPMPDAIYDVAFSADGERVAMAGGDGVAWIGTMADQAQAGLDHGHRGPLRFIAAHPNGKWVATTGDDHTLRVWDVESLRTVRVFPAGTKPLRTPAFSSDGRWVAAGSGDGRVYVFPLADGAPRVLQASADQVNALAFAPTGSVLAFSGRDGMLRVMDLDDPAGTMRVAKAHETSTECVTWSSDGLTLVTGSLGGELAWWNTRTLEVTERRQLGGGFQTVAFMESGALLATTDSVVFKLDPQRHPETKLHTEMIYDARPLGSSKALLARSSGEVLELDLERVEERVLAQGRPVHAVTLTAGEKWLAWGDEDGTLHRTAWPAPTSTEVPLVPKLEGWSLEPDGVLVEAATGIRSALTELPASRPTHVRVLPSDTLALGFENGDVGLWARAGRLLTLEHVHGRVSELTLDGGALRVRSAGDALVIPLGALLDTRAELLIRVGARPSHR